MVQKQNALVEDPDVVQRKRTTTSVTDLNGPFHPLTIESEKDSTVWKMCKLYVYIPSSLIGSPFSFNCHRRALPRKCPMQFHISDGFSVRPAAATRVSLAWHFFLQILGGNYEMVNAHRPLSPERFYPVTVVFLLHSLVDKPHRHSLILRAPSDCV